MESAHWHSGIEISNTVTPGNNLVEIHSSRMDASREVIEDGDSIFIIAIRYCLLSLKTCCKDKKIFAYDVYPCCL